MSGSPLPASPPRLPCPASPAPWPAPAPAPAPRVCRGDCAVRGATGTPTPCGASLLGLGASTSQLSSAAQGSDCLWHWGCFCWVFWWAFFPFYFVGFFFINNFHHNVKKRKNRCTGTRQSLIFLAWCIGWCFSPSCKHNLHHQDNKPSAQRDLVGWLWSFCVHLCFLTPLSSGFQCSKTLPHRPSGGFICEVLCVLVF